MNASALLSDLSALGVALSAAGGRLHVEAPAGIVTPAIRAELAAHKAELLALLAPPGAPPQEPREPVDPSAVAWLVPLLAPDMVNVAAWLVHNLAPADESSRPAPVPVADLLARSARYGFAEPDVRAAARFLGVVARGSDVSATWELPSGADFAPTPAGRWSDSPSRRRS